MLTPVLTLWPCHSQIEFPAPNENSRVHILKIHSRKMNLTRYVFAFNLLPVYNSFSYSPHIASSTLTCVSAPLLAVCIHNHRGINLRKIAELMPGASGAELKGVCTEAGMYALRERRVHVTQEDFELAQAKIMQKDSEKNMSFKKFFT